MPIVQSHTKILLILVICGLNACSQHRPVRMDPVALGRTVVQIQAIAANGKQSMGSGVVIAPNIIATNCHVTRAAKHIVLIKEDRLYRIRKQAAVPELDVCLLQSEALDLPLAELATAETIALEDPISMYGYPFGLNLRWMTGKIIALHPFANRQLIEIDSGFNFGASGGGVFNQQGQLLGLITFMSRDNAKRHFYVIPADWLNLALLEGFKPLQAFSELSFWEKGEVRF